MRASEVELHTIAAMAMGGMGSCPVASRASGGVRVVASIPSSFGLAVSWLTALHATGRGRAS